MRRAICEITDDLLRQVLHLPEGMRVTHVRDSKRPWCFDILLEGDALPERCEYREGDTPEQVTINYQMVEVKERQMVVTLEGIV
jgi:hypothetical protein